jgi:hypothetical protein
MFPSGGKVSSPQGQWHETLGRDAATEGPSNRSFGLTFAGAATVIGIVAWWRGGASAAWWLLAALLFLGIALFAHPLLTPFNRAWMRLSLLISKIANPVVMAVIFFGAVMPIGWLMRLSGRDPLRLRFDADARSYWIETPRPSERESSMTRQF